MSMNHVIGLYLTGVHASFEDSGTHHPVRDLVVHQTLTHRAVEDPNLRLLQDSRGHAWTTRQDKFLAHRCWETKLNIRIIQINISS